MAADARIDALIVGAGPVGLTMAAELTRHGLRCRIVDRNEQRSQTSKALAIWPRTLELLDDMGIAGRFVGAGLRASGGRIKSGGRELVRLRLDDLPTPYPFLLLLPQDQSERLLEEHLTELGIDVERRTELRTLARTDSGVAVLLRRSDGAEERVECAWLLGCDGAHSTVRHQLGIEFAGTAEPNDWILADVHIDGDLPPDEMSLFLHADGLLAFFPIGVRRFRIIADIGAARAGEAPQPTLADVQRLIDGRGPGGLTARDAVWLSGFRINERKVARYRAGRVFLAGDAAHIHSPAGGQGMNTGMQDAYNLAWKLALAQHGRARVEPLLDSYSAERSPVAEAVLRNAGAMTRVGTLRNPMAQAVRNLVVPVVASLGFVQSTIRGTLSELDINYRSSPLSRAAHGRGVRRGAVRAGDRVPDAALDGGRGRLFDLLRGTHHTLLLLGDPTAASLREIAAAVDGKFPALFRSHASASPALRELFAAQVDSAAVVVRPDGYVAFIGAPAAAGALLSHLESYLTATT